LSDIFDTLFNKENAVVNLCDTLWKEMLISDQ
jgi:hypothetical protein